jgi:hypothetical protein
MPTIPNYIMGNDDLNAMDDLLLAKRKMLNKMKIEETEIKFDNLKNVDSKLIIANYNGAEKLLRSTIELFKIIDNRIDRPRMSAKKGTPISSIVKETDISMIEINDNIDKIITNFTILYDTIYNLLPFSKYISQKNFDTFYKLVGDFYEIFNYFRETKLMDTTGNILLRILGNTRFTADELLANFNFLNVNFEKFYNVWKRFIENYKSQQKVEIK